MQLIPGGGAADKVADSVFPGAGKASKKAVEAITPDIPLPPAPPPASAPPAFAEEPEIAASKQRETEKRRKGRRASILTSAKGVEEDLGLVNRPQARAAGLLGQV